MTTLTLTDEQLVLLDRAIAELPYKDAAPLVAAINEQIKSQREPAPAPSIDREPMVLPHHAPTDDSATTHERSAHV